MDKIDKAKEELFKLLDKFCAGLAERGYEYSEVAATIRLNEHEVRDTLDNAFPMHKEN